MIKLLFCFPLLAIPSNKFGTEFLAENAKKSGVITLPSGLQYKVLRMGDGSFHPTINSPCECHYEGRLAENYPAGVKFDSSYDRGSSATFAPNQVIRGWTEAMQLMVVGDKWEMYIPSNLAYGDHGRPPKIPPGAVLVFTMEIIKIKGGTVPAKKQPKTNIKGSTVPAKKQPKTNVSTTSPSFKLIFEVGNLVGVPAVASFTMEVQPAWAPLGAQRLRELADAKFFDDVRFFRVIDNFMAQFGIHGDPSVMQDWRDRNIKDDPPKKGISNRRGAVSFATSGPNTRSTQLFINFKDNSFLDSMGFTPVAKVIQGMDVVDRIFKIGEGAPKGPGPRQGDIQERGNAYLKKRFGQLSYVKSCSVVTNVLPTNRSQGDMTLDLGSGLKLVVIRAGDGKTFPQTGDRVTVHYVLTLAGDTSGKIIDSSRARGEPFTFNVGKGQVIRGWDRGVMKMSLSQRGKLIVPSALGYGRRGAGAAIPPNANLVFDIEILEISHFSIIGSTPWVLGIVVAVSGVLISGLCYCVRRRRSTSSEKGFDADDVAIGRSAPE